MSTLIALAKISLGAVSVAGVGAVSAFAIKNNGFTGNHSNTISKQGQQDPVPATPPAQSTPPAVPQIPETTLPNAAPLLPISDPQPTPTKLSVVLVKQQTKSTSQSESQLSVSGETQPYKCRLKAQSSEDASSICNLVELTIPNKWIDLAGIKQATQSAALSLDDLKDATKQFKLEVSEALFKKATTTPSTIVEIVSTTTSPTVHAELTTLFKVDGNTVDYENFSTLLGRADGAYTTIPTSKTNRCPLTADTTPSDDHICTFQPFGSSTTTYVGAGYSKVTDLDVDAADSTSLTADKYYFVNYSTPLAKSTLASLSKVYVNEVGTPDSTATNKTTLDNAVPVIFNGSGENKKAFILSETQTFKGVVVKKDSIASPKTLTFNAKSHTYKCKYDSNIAANCELSVIPFTTTKTSHNTSEIKAITTTPDVTITDTTSPNSYYKVEVDATFFTTFKAGTTSKSIQILDETNASKRLFTLDILYSIDDNAEYEAESSYVVNNATLASNPVNFTEDQKKYCAFADTEASTLSNALECEIKDLGTSITTNTNFKTPTDATSILTTNTYLVTFVEASGVTVPVAKDIKDKPLLFLQVATDDIAKTKVASFAKANIDYALIVDGPEANKFAFVLNKPTDSN